MKIIVRPGHERSRTFKFLPQAMRFAQEARARQGERVGSVPVFAEHDGVSYFVGLYGRVGGIAEPARFGWGWAKAV